MLLFWFFGICILGATDATDCPNFWVPFDGSCYRFGHQDLTFFEAEHYCQQHQAHLVHIETQDENNFLKQELTDRKAHDWWIGLTDDDVEGTFVWYGTNNKPEFTDWSPGNPSDSGNNEDCGELHLSPTLHWNDDDCHKLNQAICEKESASGVVIG